MADPEHQEEANLSQLLSALAVGVRVVHVLPLEDEFDYQATFPEFSSLVGDAKSDLQEILGLALHEFDQDDYLVWEKCANACDWLIEQAELYLKDDSSEKLELTHWSSVSKQQASSSYTRMIAGIVEMEKSQITYNIVVDNDRTAAFIPFGQSSTVLRPGRANDLRYGAPDNVTFLGEEQIGPSQYCPHAKRSTILELTCSYKAPSTAPPAIVADDELPNKPHVWISTTEELEELSKALEKSSEIAVDLEAHSYRSFAGMVCLMQITFRSSDTQNELPQDYLIDTLALWHDIHAYLEPIFSSPEILKVMHGADSDVAWLQRDFGIHVVNLLDTGRAARLLKLPSFGLAHLLFTYVSVKVDKKYQLSDWRQRPLTKEMQLYAKMDTHYLLDIAQHLLYAVDQHSSPEVSLEALFEASQKVCLIRYDKEIFRTQGYKSLISNKRKSKSELSETQEAVLAVLYDWRDAVARDCDESPSYVCHNKALLRLSLACPTTVASLTSLLNPIPPLVLRFAQDVLDRIKETSLPEASSFFMPAEEPSAGETTTGRGLMSPVLGTEALYKQAGWMTPSHVLAHNASTEEEDDVASDNNKPKIIVDDANKDYHNNNAATGFSSHSLVSGSSDNKTADGFGTSKGLSEEPQEASERAVQSALNLRKTLEQSNLMALISPAVMDDDEDEDEEEEEDQDDDSEEFEIPRSMREIYKVSNKNRRNKKASDGVSTEGDAGLLDVKKHVDSLEGADAILKARGAKYFDTASSSSSKRQKQQDEDEVEVSQDEDIAFMQKIGWIKDKEEAESLKPRPRGDSEEFGDGAEESTENKEVADFASTSNIGAYDPTAPAPANPFFTGAAGAAGETTFDQGSSGPRARTAKRGKKTRASRGTREERPDRNRGRTAVYKNR